MSELRFEESIEEYLLSHGWSRVAASGYDRVVGLVPDELIAFIAGSQPDEWDQLVSRHGGQTRARARVVRRVADELTARGTVDVLRRGVKDSGVSFRVAFFAPANGLTPGLWERYRANRLSVVRQLHHSETRAGQAVDVALFVNGIPTASAELKNPAKGTTVTDAITQYRTSRVASDLVFQHRMVVHFAVDPDQVYMTTRLAGAGTVFLPFNQGSGGAGGTGGAGNPPNPGGYRTAYLWERVWQPDAWLGLLGDYVHVEDLYDEMGVRTGGTRTLFPRFHQWDAVEKLVAATRRAGPGVDRLVEHSAGSGKSNTIAWMAHRLSRLHTPTTEAEVSPMVRAAGLGADEPIFHKVIVITDRVVLDRQLQSTVAGFEHTPGTIVKIDKDSQQLRAALEGNAARVIITTLQKFPIVAETATRIAGQRFAVVVDEAHSSTTGEAMKDMKQVLTGGDTGGGVDEAAVLAAAETAESAAEAVGRDATDLLAESMAARGRQANLAFFAFTATPKPKTLELFGEHTTGVDGVERFVPFHLYSMRQAIAEGFILDVLRNYTTYGTYYRLANHTPEGGVREVEDPEVPVGKASAALARFVSLHPTNLGQKAEIIVEHFRQKTAGKIGGRAKAMVVTRSRLHAVRYKQAIDTYLTRMGYDRGERGLRALVAFSGTVIDPTAPAVSYTEATMNGFGEAALPKRFATDDFQVLVVAEKYQTGFDQPLLHTMYVDKKLTGVKAVQTLSRLNRIHPGKTDTFVLDFANTRDEIIEAFAPFYEETSATPTDPNLLYTLQRRILDAGVIDPTEMTHAVQALLLGGTARQRTVYADTATAVDRFTGLDPDTQDGFRDAVTDYLRAYSFLAQAMTWNDRDLEALYLYCRVLAPQLPARGDEPLPQISGTVLLTHLRTELTGDTTNADPIEGNDTPGTAFNDPTAAGPHTDAPTERLSVLIRTLNDKFGMNLTDADTVWFEQQKQAVKDDQEARAVALHNDRDQFQVFLSKFAGDAIIDRHEANGMLFDAFFTKPGFKDALLEYLQGAYDEIRETATP